MNTHSHRGFSLIELMIVVAIVGILASIAYPAYISSILKGRRAQARAAVMELLQQQERYLTQQNTYLIFSNSSGTTLPATAATTFKVFAGDNTTNASYWLSADQCPDGSGGTLNIIDCVRVSATPVPVSPDPRSDPEVGTLRMTSTGTKDCTGTTTNTSLCWP